MSTRSSSRNKRSREETEQLDVAVPDNENEQQPFLSLFSEKDMEDEEMEVFNKKRKKQNVIQDDEDVGTKLMLGSSVC